jgi:hypothetical protein
MSRLAAGVFVRDLVKGTKRGLFAWAPPTLRIGLARRKAGRLESKPCVVGDSQAVFWLICTLKCVVRRWLATPGTREALTRLISTRSTDASRVLAYFYYIIQLVRPCVDSVSKSQDNG